MVLGLAVVGVATALALRGPVPELGPVIVLGALFMLAENQVVELPNNADVSISFMLGMAAIVVFYGNGSPLGPMLVGICGGIYLPHVMAGDWRKVFINSANFGFAMLATAAVFNLLAPSGPLEVGPLVLLAFPAAVVFMVLNLGMFGLTGVVFTGKYPNLIDIFGPLIPQTYPFSILGVVPGPAVRGLRRRLRAPLRRPDPRRPPDLRVLPRAQGVAGSGGPHAHRRARGQGPVHRRDTPNGSPTTRSTSATSWACRRPGWSGCASPR